MLDRKLSDSLSNFGSALENLESAFKIDRNQELAKEGTIHRFETAVELAWKTISRALHHEGIEAWSPRACVREAFQMGWIEDEPAWLSLIDSRNLTSHEYLDEELVDQNYDEIVRLTPTLRSVFEVLLIKFPMQ